MPSITDRAAQATHRGRPRSLAPELLGELAGRVRPQALAGEQCLPVPRALEPLLPDHGLRRGAVVAVDGSVALALALVAGASAAGSWVAAVSLPDLGVAAAAEAGVVLERLALVPGPDLGTWAPVVVALLEAIDVVLVRPPPRLAAGQARRLAARTRERGAVLLPLGRAWPGPVDLRLTVTASRWEGLDQGYGRLRGRLVEVVSGGRGAASRERRARLWLPSPREPWEPWERAGQPRHERYVRAVEEGDEPRGTTAARADGAPARRAG